MLTIQDYADAVPFYWKYYILLIFIDIFFKKSSLNEPEILKRPTISQFDHA
jgi:hypothetical protein